jgi:hypothetical protein
MVLLGLPPLSLLLSYARRDAPLRYSAGRRRTDNANKGTDNANKGTDNANKGADNANKGADNANKGPH